MTTITDQNYGSVLKKAREDKNVTQEELAKRAGVGNKSYISRIENQKICPTVNTYFKLIHSLGYVIKIGDKEF
jgi:transcriptional regulator with XRE-family HTH domain